MNELALFAGAGGGILGGKLLGWKTVAACEIEKYPRKVLLQRQKDGLLPRFPIWDDIRTFDGNPWRDKIDIITGGFPCQDISSAGKGAGISGERSGLWSEMARVIREVRPEYAFVENSPLLISRGLEVVLGDLAEMGYNAVWCIMGADDVGACHRRKRIWILAYSDRFRFKGCMQKKQTRKNWKQSRRKVVRSNIAWWNQDPADIPHSNNYNESGQSVNEISRSSLQEPQGKNTGSTNKPRLGRVAYGVVNRVDRLKAIGSGQVPGVAATAFLVLWDMIK